MIEYIQGRMTEKYPTHIIVETGGIGYFVNISLHTYSALSQDQVKIFIHQIIREDAHILYGFFTDQEREVFRRLISVSGIGANTARTILSSLSPDQVQGAILSGDVNAFKSVKGIGLKTAQRLIVELKDKMGRASTAISADAIVRAYDVRREALDALEVLGFARRIAEPVVERLFKTRTDISVEELIKLTLKSL